SFTFSFCTPDISAYLHTFLSAAGVHPKFGKWLDQKRRKQKIPVLLHCLLANGVYGVIPLRFFQELFQRNEGPLARIYFATPFLMEYVEYHTIAGMTFSLFASKAELLSFPDLVILLLAEVHGHIRKLFDQYL